MHISCKQKQSFSPPYSVISYFYAMNKLTRRIFSYILPIIQQCIEYLYYTFVNDLCRPSKVLTSTRSARSQETSPSVVVFWLDKSRRWRCSVPLSFGETTSTTSGNTTDSRNDTGTCLSTCHLVSGTDLTLVNCTV